MDEQFWDQARGKWNSHAAFNTVNHQHVSCYFPAVGHPNCEIMVVECADGRFYLEDEWGGDAQDAEKVWNPARRDAGVPYFFTSEAEAMAHAISVVSRISGVPESAVSSI